MEQERETMERLRERDRQHDRERERAREAERERHFVQRPGDRASSSHAASSASGRVRQSQAEVRKNLGIVRRK